MADRQRAETDSILSGAETIDLQEEGSHGVLLLHGFGDTPQTLSLLARRLAKRGFGVLAPLLPGHGRDMAAFRRGRADEWVDAARHSLVQMRERYATVSIVGLSMGAALAVLVATERTTIASLVLIAPYLRMPVQIRLAAAVHWLWDPIVGEINSRNPRSIRDPIEREKNLAYGTVTGRTLFELAKVVRRSRKALPRVTAPTLVILSQEDPRVPPDVGEFALRTLGARDKKMVWTEGAGHIITVDYGRERVFSEVEKWLRLHDSSSATAAEDDRAAVERP